MQFLSIGGERTKRVDLMYGTENAPPDAPFVSAAELGFHPLSSAGGGLDLNIVHFASLSRDAELGQYVALFDAAAGNKFALVQDNRGNTRRSYYERYRPQPRRAWRDWFYSAAYVLFTEIDARWRSTDVVLAHPTGHGWGPPEDPELEDMPEAFLEGLGHSLDHSDLALSRIWLHPCCLDAPDTIVRAARRLEREGSASHRPIPTVQIGAREMTVPAPSRCKLLRVDLERGDP